MSESLQIFNPFKWLTPFAVLIWVFSFRSNNYTLGAIVLRAMVHEVSWYASLASISMAILVGLLNSRLKKKEWENRLKNLEKANNVDQLATLYIEHEDQTIEEILDGMGWTLQKTSGKVREWRDNLYGECTAYGGPFYCPCEDSRNNPYYHRYTPGWYNIPKYIYTFTGPQGQVITKLVDNFHWYFRP